MRLMSTCVLNYDMPSLQGCLYCIFVSLVVSASSLLSRVLVVAVLLGCFCYILLPCKPVATSHSMHNLKMYTKDVLLYMSCLSIRAPVCIYSLLYIVVILLSNC